MYVYAAVCRETDIGEAATKEANKQVKRVLEQEREYSQRKVYGSYIDADRAAVGLQKTTI